MVEVVEFPTLGTVRGDTGSLAVPLMYLANHPTNQPMWLGQRPARNQLVYLLHQPYGLFERDYHLLIVC